jgi:hypothetical protein
MRFTIDTNRERVDLETSLLITGLYQQEMATYATNDFTEAVTDRAEALRREIDQILAAKGDGYRVVWDRETRQATVIVPV